MATAKKAISKRKAVSKKVLANKKPSSKKAPPSKSVSYLTKRILTSAAKSGFSSAAAATMQAMGYNVIVQNGWVVKKFADGRIEKITKLETANTRTSIALD